MGTDPTPANARADNFKLKQALWAENDKEIRLELDKKEKVNSIEMPTKKIERNYLADLTLSAKYWTTSKEIDHHSGKTECTAGTAPWV